MATEEHAELRIVRAERPVGILNYRLFWLAVAVIVGMGGLVLAARGNSVPWGIGWLMIVSVAYVIVVLIPLGKKRTTLLAIYYRHLNHIFRNKTGRNLHMSRLAQEGEYFGVGEEGEVLALSKVKRPIEPIKGLGKVEILNHPVSSKVNIGITDDWKLNTRTGSLIVATSSQLGDDQPQKLARMASWSQVLNRMALGGSSIYRFGWAVQTIIGEKVDPAKDVAFVQRRMGLTSDGPHLDSYLQLVKSEAREAPTHITTMSISVHPGDIDAQALKTAGSPEKVLQAELLDFKNHITGKWSGGISPIGVQDAQFLSYNHMVLLSRLRLDPEYARYYWDNRGNLLGKLSKGGLLNPQIAVPPYADFKSSPDWCRLGKTVHIGLVVHDFPRSGMTEDHLEAIINVPVAKTVTAVYQMIPKAVAQLRAEFSTGAVSTDIARRSRKGRRITEATKAAADIELEHEREVARNVGQVARMSLFIDVTGGALELEKVIANAEKVRFAAGDAGDFLEYLDGRQHLGVEAAMLTTRGLDAKSAPRWLR